MENLKEIKGIGPRTIEHLEKLSIHTPEDLITHYPFRYEVLRKTNISNLEDGGRVVTDGTVASIPVVVRFKGKMNKMHFTLQTDELTLNVVIYNRAFLSMKLEIGKVITIIGKLDKKKNTIVASDILFKPLGEEVTVEPIYRTTSGINKKTLRKYINEVINEYNEIISDNIPDDLKEKYGFLE